MTDPVYKTWLERAYDAAAASRVDPRWRHAADEHDALEHRIVAQGRPQIGDRLLELGCGTGTLTHKLASAVGPSGRVTAVDLSNEMLRMAGMSAGQSPCATVEFRKADFDGAEIEVGAFDGIYSKWAIELSSDVAALMRKMVSGLARRGRLVLATVGDPSLSTVSCAARFIRNSYFAPVQESAETPNAFCLSSEARLLDAALSANICEATVTSHLSKIRFRSAIDLTDWLCETQGPVRGLLAHLPTPRSEAAKIALAEFFRGHAARGIVATQQSIILTGAMK